jgi:uncharacterized protein (DUF2384 family)
MRQIQGQNERRIPAHLAGGLQDVSGAVATALNILDRWQATPEEQQAMLGVSRRTWFAWRRKAPSQVDPDRLERISYLLGIWKGLRQLFPGNRAYETWPRLPNDAPLFAGRTPMEVMSAGHVADLYKVRAWIDGWRGWN